MKNYSDGHCDCYSRSTGAKVWSNWEPGAWEGEPAPLGAPFGCGEGAGYKTACESLAAATIGQLRTLLPWRRPEPPERKRKKAEYLAARRAVLSRAAQVVEAAGAPAPPPAPAPTGAYTAPFSGTYYFVKEGVTGHCDAYLKDGGTLVWSNWKHGAWAGAAPPEGAPFGCGVGA